MKGKIILAETGVCVFCICVCVTETKKVEKFFLYLDCNLEVLTLRLPTMQCGCITVSINSLELFRHELGPTICQVHCHCHYGVWFKSRKH